MSTIRAELPALTIRRGPSAFAVGRAAARVVVAGAVLIAGFVAYEFGVTSVLASRAQAGLRNDLTSSPVSVADVAYAPAVLSPAPVVVLADLPSPDPTITAPADGTIRVMASSTPGNAIGTIVIPSAGVDWAFVEGVDGASLHNGVGHMPGTALPGEPGNAVLSGHRTTYGAPSAPRPGRGRRPDLR